MNALKTESEYPAWLDRDCFPFERRELLVNECRLHYIDEGSGPVLLMVPPAPAWIFIYRHLIRELSHQFRCIAFDLPGFGFSGAPAGFDYSLAALSSVCEAFTEALALRDINLMVHDTGGAVGLGMAGRRPELIESLIITDTFAWPLDDYPRARFMLRLITSPPFSFLQKRWNIIGRAVCGPGSPGRVLSPAEKRGHLGGFPDAESRARVLRVFRRLVTENDYLRETEQNLFALREKPALLIYGEKDPARLMGWQDRFADLLPLARAEIVPGEGHFPHEGRPDIMARMIRAWRFTASAAIK